MIGKNAVGADCESCDYPEYNLKTPSAVKDSKKEVSKLNVFIHEPKHFQKPVIVSFNLKEKQIRFPNLTKRSRWRSRKAQKPLYELKPEDCVICRWYKRKKAQKSLRDQNKREQKKEKQRRREEYERERINDLLRWENGKQQKEAREEEKRIKREEYQRERMNDIIRSEYEKQQKAAIEEERRKKKEEYERERVNDIRYEYEKQQKAITRHEPTPQLAPRKLKKKEVTIKEKKFKPKPWSRKRKIVDFPEEKKEKKIKRTFKKEKSASAKPQARTKQVYVKKYKPKNSLTYRFVNCCYRICCQFYCCLTCVLIITLAILFVL